MNITIDEIKKRLTAIKKMGYVKSLRKGPTGIGYIYMLISNECNIALNRKIINFNIVKYANICFYYNIKYNQIYE